MGQISLEGMEFFSYHGHFKEEQIIGTRFTVDLYMETDTKEAEVTDNLAKTVNYQAVYNLVAKEMAVKSHLLENVARRILDRIATGISPDNCFQDKDSKDESACGRES